jgi:hypothetical protein
MSRFVAASFAVTAALSTTSVHAGDGSSPATIAVELEALQGDLSEVTFVAGATSVTPVLSLAETHALNPLGITVIRQGNHSIAKGTGKSVSLRRAVAGDGGAVFVTYVHHTGNLLMPRIRKIAADNTTAFDITFNGSSLAGIAPDGAGGLLFAQQLDSTANGGHDFVQSRIVFRRYAANGEVLWQAETPNWPYPEVDAGPGEGPASRWVTTIASDTSMTVGYAHTDGTLPGIERRSATDGALLFRTHALKAAAPPPAAGRGKPGALGTTPLTGRPNVLVAAADNSVIANVDGHVIRLDTNGVQTHAYECGGAEAQGKQMRCTSSHDGEQQVDDYAVVDGQLVVVRTTTTQFPEGWTMVGGSAEIGGGKRLIGAKTPAGKVGVVLVGSAGQVLAKKATTTNAPPPGTFSRLAAAAGKWIFYISGEPKWTRIQGTYFGGSSGAGATAPNVVPQQRRGR